MNKQYKIAHFADVHFRGLSRHEEYKTVFKKIFKQLKDESVDAIVIAGDIVHTKTQGISPEIIEILTWWFKSFANIAPTYVALGNHDGLIHNTDRQDAITPIINAINDDRLKLFKQSGNYETHMPGVRIANFSCFDEENWDSVTKEGDIVIAVYHGSISGASTDSDYNTEGESDLSLFRGCHFGMFGDIHKFQFLDKEKRFAYPGSTIQQNYGEALDKGYLLWRISSKDDFSVERKIVETPNPYITIEWQGNVQNTIEETKKFKKGSRFRISFSNHVMQEEIKQLSSYLKEEMNSSEIVWKSDVNSISTKISSESLNIKRKSLREVATHKEFLESIYPEDKNIEKYTEEIGKILSQIEDPEVNRNQKWELEKLEWDNTFSYGKGNIIDFSSLSGIIGLFGRNRIGKSSIAGTIMYTLFNDTDRGSLSNLHIVNTRKGHCIGTAEFKVSGHSYRVERQTVKRENKKGDVSAPTQLNFFKLDENGDVVVDLSGEQRNESDKELRKLIGTANDFLLTSFAAQGEMNNYIRQGATARKNLLSRFLDLQVLEQIYLKLKEISASHKFLLKTLPERNFRLLKIECIENIASCTKIICDTESEIFSIENEKKILNENLLKNKIDESLYTKQDIDLLEKKLANLESSLKKEKQNLELKESELLKIDKKIAAIEQIKNNFPIDSLRKKLKENLELDKKTVTFRHDIEKNTLILSSQEKSAKKLNEVPCGESFPTCKFIKDSIRDKNLIEDQKKKIASLKENLKSVLSILENENSDDIKTKIEKYDSAIGKEKLLNSQKTNHNLNIEILKKNIEKFSESISSLKVEIENAKDNLTDSPQAESNSRDKARIQEIDKRINDLRSEHINAHSKKAVLQQQIIDLDEEEKRLFEVKSNWEFYEKLILAYSKDGIPLLIIKNELPRINHEISEILSGVAGFTVTLENEDAGSKLDIYIDYGDSKRPIELGSGMEKLMASLAIRVALINISSLPKSDIFIIDEGFGALDEQNIDACNKFLHSLKRYFKTILIISHIDAVKDAVDGFIEITTNGADSRVIAAETIPNY